jgi:hypothetical protein
MNTQSLSAVTRAGSQWLLARDLAQGPEHIFITALAIARFGVVVAKHRFNDAPKVGARRARRRQGQCVAALGVEL